MENFFSQDFVGVQENNIEINLNVYGLMVKFLHILLKFWKLFIFHLSLYKSGHSQLILF